MQIERTQGRELNKKRGWFVLLLHRPASILLSF